MDELVPGISIEERMGMDENALLKQELALQAAEAEEIRASRVSSILSEVSIALHKGYRVDITEEMKELALEIRIRTMIQKAEYFHKLNKFFLDDDGEDEPTEFDKYGI